MYIALKNLNEVDLSLLKSYLIPRMLEKGDIVYCESDPAIAMYFIESGALKTLHRTTASGSDDQIVSIIRPGGFSGEEALLAENPRYQITTIALEKSVLLELSRASLQDLMSKSMSTGTKVLLGISRNYREAMVTPEQTAKLFVFYSPKDGVGRTTLAVNVAAQLAVSTGKRVLFIDADFQFGNAALLLHVSPALNIARLIQVEANLTFDRIKLFMVRSSGLDTLLCPDLPQEAELVTRESVAQILHECSRQYDFIVLDAKSNIDDQTLLFWDRADRIILVGTPSLGNLQRLHRLFKLYSRLDYSHERFQFVLNRFRPTDTEFLTEFQKLAKGRALTIDDDPAVTCEAEINGSPFALSQATKNIHLDLQALVRELLGNVQPKQKQGGIFSRIKSLFAG
ncbi:MAG: cyclic nucleotide-binding domain-containing protein [Candidatus Riflebacteria bacterium]|nr:cyclic nucleotide-binding domain-containing protein [Candidatus Riflebacteria bacterium]